MDPYSEAAKWKELAMRYKADLDNNNRRLAQERIRSAMERYRPLVESLLPIVDDLEAALGSGYDHGALLNGVQQVLRKLTKALGEHGVQEVDPLGELFNPNLHEAISVIYKDDIPCDSIVQVLRKGWLLNERLIRAPLVVTSKPYERK